MSEALILAAGAGTLPAKHAHVATISGMHKGQEHYCKFNACSVMEHAGITEVMHNGFDGYCFVLAQHTGEEPKDHTMMALHGIKMMPGRSSARLFTDDRTASPGGSLSSEDNGYFLEGGEE